MSDLSDSVTRKFVDSISLDDWEIETDTGWEDVTAIHKTVKYQEWHLVLVNGMSLICADDHIVFTENMDEIFVKDLKPGKKVMTSIGPIEVKYVRDTTLHSNMYDVTVNSPNHRFYSGNILSHNTTTAVLVILHYVLFQSHKLVALLANKGDSAREILERIKIAFEALPKWLQQGVIVWNKGSVEFENGCKIVAAATSSSAIRGKSVSFLYIDETAFIENWDEFFSSVFPTLSSGTTTKILLTSTPKGLNHFYKTCDGARRDVNPATGIGNNGYIYIEVPWKEVPGRDEKWKDEQLAAMDFDHQKFAQEFECVFHGSSGTLIEGNILESLKWEHPIVDRDSLNIYEQGDVSRTYVMVVDVSRGKGLDYSAFQVVDVTEMPYKVVATYRENTVTPIDYAEIIYQVHKGYNDCYILVEINDIGGQVADLLHYDYEIDTILFTESAGRNGKRISGGFGQNVDKGIRTTKSVKTIGCNMLKMLIEQGQLIVKDLPTINELSTFSKKGVSYEAESGCHDDLVMCLVLFGWLSDQAFFREVTDINTMYKLKQRKEEEIMENMMPIGFNTDDINREAEQVVNFFPSFPEY